MNQRHSELAASYDRVAEHYADEFYCELERKPFDCELLDQFAKRVCDQGSVCELGCGPGHIASYLQERGLNMVGIDLSAEMINCARRLSPHIAFEQGNMLTLAFPDASLAAIICFYAIIHLGRDELTQALQEMNRVLQPGGRLLLSFHGGEGELHRDQWYDKPVSIDVTLFANHEMSSFLESSGFKIDQIVERVPYEFEYPTRRVYILARKPFEAK